MKKLVLLLLFVIFLSVALSAQASEAFDLDLNRITIVRFVEDYAYRYTSFGGSFKSNSTHMFIPSSDSAVMVATSSAMCTVDTKNLEVVQAITTFFEISDPPTYTDMYSLYAFVAALEFDPAYDPILSLEGRSVLTEARNVIDDITDAMDADKLFSGETIICYQGKRYSYSLTYSENDRNGKQYIYLFADRL